MPPTPTEQQAPFPNEQRYPHPPQRAGGQSSQKQQRATSTSRTTPTTPHQRQGDRSADDNDDAAPRLTTYVRFRELVAAGIIRNWPTLRRLIREQQFPAGKMIGPNTRAWPVNEIESWLATRPTDNENIRLKGGKKKVTV
jgi:predicted DNA-binding transcriptional regulator AlpA